MSDMVPHGFCLLINHHHQQGRGRVSARVRAELNSFWAIVGFMTNTLIFVVAVRGVCRWGIDEKEANKGSREGGRRGRGRKGNSRA